MLFLDSPPEVGESKGNSKGMSSALFCSEETFDTPLSAATLRAERDEALQQTIR